MGSVLDRRRHQPADGHRTIHLSPLHQRPRRTANDLDDNAIPDILARWDDPAEAKRARTDPSFLVPKEEIADNDFDLSINRYKEIVYEEIEYEPTADRLEKIAEMESGVTSGIEELKGLLK